MKATRRRNATPNRRDDCPPASGGLMTAGGACVAAGRVFAASKRGGKRMSSKPFGGIGVVRAIDVKSGLILGETPVILEANTVPAYSPSPTTLRALL